MSIIKYSLEISLIETRLKVAIIGGGINGIFTAWKLSEKGYQVDLFDSKSVLSQTSSSSSKLLHGGIRYLELGHFSLVRQSLVDRYWWYKNAQEYCTPFEMIIPIYLNSKRRALVVYLGAILYQFLAGKFSLGKSRWISKNEIKANGEISHKQLKAAVSFYDLQMDEDNLGHWVKDKAIKNGVHIFENTKISSFDDEGNLYLPNKKNSKYNYIINMTGPWAASLNKKNNINTPYDLNLIKGSHLLLDLKIKKYYLLQEKNGDRIVFIMPYKNLTLIGTTEVEQDINDKIECSNNERDYLLGIYNEFFNKKATKENINSSFSGLRPIVKKINKINKKITSTKASREMVITKNNKLISLYGGKWTSAPSTALKIIKYLK